MRHLVHLKSSPRAIALFWLSALLAAGSGARASEAHVPGDSRAGTVAGPPSGGGCANGRPQPGTAACIGHEAISLEDIDRGGGHAVHEALEQLYRQRTLTLYQRLSDDLLAREAKAQHTSVEKLLDLNVNAHTPAPTPEAIAQFLQERTGSATADPQRTQQVSTLLALKDRAEHKRAYVETLFKRYEVHVNLTSPPAAPAEEVRGPEDLALGPSAAPIKLIVFSDYLCPYCRALSHTLDQLLTRYPKDLQIVYRHFPIHPQADRLAEAVQCASAQGHFADFHRALFERSTVTLESMRPLAEELGLDRTAFATCLDSERFRARVEQDLAEGNRLVINGTPTLFLNGLRLEGSQSLESLSAQIQRLQHPAAGSLAAGASGPMR